MIRAAMRALYEGAALSFSLAPFSLAWRFPAWSETASAEWPHGPLRGPCGDDVFSEHTACVALVNIRPTLAAWKPMVSGQKIPRRWKRCCVLAPPAAANVWKAVAPPSPAVTQRA